MSWITTLKPALILSISFMLIAGCNNDDDDPTPAPGYTIPETYSFDNVDYSGQLERLSMMLEMKAYMRSANTPGTIVDADRLSAMYRNDAANAGWVKQYDASKQIKGKTFEAEQERYEAFINALATASQSVEPAAEGTAGVATSLDGAKQYLLNENGVEYAQIIEKGLMGACFYYQATAVYLGEGKMNVDNETVTPGSGTAMEHHWDEAFGYLGVPRDFPFSTDGVVFWGDYCNDRDPMMNTNEPLMNAFLEGRAAISNGDLVTRDAAIPEVRRAWEMVVVGTAIHYLNQAIDKYDDFAIRAHALSEAVAFLYSLQFNPEKRLSNQEVDDLLQQLGGDANFAGMNFYQVTAAGISAARDQLAEAFDLMSVKENL